MKKQIMHFASPELRMKYLKGKFEEIVPKKVKSETEALKSETEEPKEEKPKKKKSAKKGKKDEVQAE